MENKEMIKAVGKTYGCSVDVNGKGSFYKVSGERLGSLQVLFYSDGEISSSLARFLKEGLGGLMDHLLGEVKQGRDTKCWLSVEAMNRVKLSWEYYPGAEMVLEFKWDDDFKRVVVERDAYKVDVDAFGEGHIYKDDEVTAEVAVRCELNDREELDLLSLDDSWGGLFKPPYKEIEKLANKLLDKLTSDETGV